MLSVTVVQMAPSRERTLSSPTHQRQQLVARKGSASAPDPFGVHTSSAPCSRLSKLTVVRGPPPPKEKGEVTGSAGRRPSHRRQDSTGSISRTGAERSSSPCRLSFATASFAAAHANSPQAGPTGHHRRNSSASSISSGLGVSFHRLSPYQVHDLAKQSVYPSMNTFANINNPESFTRLEDNIFLPFVDRPGEVGELLSKGTNAKIMTLLAAIFIHSSQKSDSDSENVEALSASPETWCFTDLQFWLTRVSREEVTDMKWVNALQSALLPRSEVVWERLRSMLGIPLESDSPVGSRSNPGKSSYTERGLLNIEEIIPSPLSPSVHLEGITEVAEDEEETDHSMTIIHGLRLTTPLSFPSLSRPSSPSLTSPPLSPQLRLRTISQSSVPLRSSPLAPSRRTNVVTSPVTAGSSHSTQKSVVHDVPERQRVRPSKAAAKPLFPMSFDKLEAVPTLLSCSR